MASRRARLLAAAVAASVAFVIAGVVATTGGAAKSEPGGSLSVNGTVQDRTTGQTFGVSLNMEEDATEAGRGGTFFQLNGPSITVCDAHGEGASSGSTPLATMQCGGSGNVSVAVDGCTAKFETHGITHADHPWTVYLGPMTLDVTFTYNARQGSGELVVQIYTPKDVIEIAGPTNGSVAMSTCT